MSDQRKSARADVSIYLNKYIAGVPYTARAEDISPSGLGLSRLIEPESTGRRVGLQFQLPGSDEVIYAEGEVVREWAAASERERSAIRFTLLTERHRKMIDAFVGAKGSSPQP